MRLRQLELQGFKTFATRTSLEFAPGITAIVGPNGCGKSNLADAVRWALGEQSLRLLRSSGKEDVIFAGSNGRAPLGVAEVTLTLDNEDGWLPLEFSEVSLGRRAYRSGENEYLINRRRVRLRDVYYLLANAGLGHNGTTVVGQGMVEVMLTQRPEERRALFEDAAGVRRYELQRAEAEAKLREAEQNTTRIADLMAELEPRAASLKRQARRAMDDARLRAEWAAAVSRLLGHQLAEVEAELSALSDQRAAAASARTRAQSERDAALTAVRAAHEEVADIRNRRATLEDKIRTLDARRQEALRTRVAAQERLRAAEQALRDQVAERERAEKCQSDLAARRPRLQEQCAAAAGRLANAWMAVKAAEAAAEHTAQRRAGLERGASTARAEAEQARRLLACATTELRETERRRAAAARDLAEAEHGAARVRASLTSLDEGVARLECAETAAAGRQQAAAAERVRALAALRAAEQRLEQLAERRGQVAVRRRAAAERLRLLRSGASGSTGRRVPPPPGPTVAELLLVPERLEAAIAAALGPALQWLVVSTRQEARAYARALATARAARRTVVALEDMASHQMSGHEGKVTGGSGEAVAVSTRPLTFLQSGANCPNGAAGTTDQRWHPVSGTRLTATAMIALDEVGVRGGYEAVANTLVGNLLLAETLDAALEASSAVGAGSGVRIVSLTGEVVEASGAITAGTRPDSASLLAQAREIRELEAQVAASDREDGDLAPRVAAAWAEVDAGRAAVAAVDDEVRALAQQRSRYDGERHTLPRQRAAWGKDLAWWEALGARATEATRQVERRGAELARRRDHARAALRAADADQQGLSSKTEQAVAEALEAREQLAQARTELALAAQQHADLQRVAQDSDEQLNAAEQEAARHQKRVRRLEEERDALRRAAAKGESSARDDERALADGREQLQALEAHAASLEVLADHERARLEDARARAEEHGSRMGRLEAQEAALLERRRGISERASREVGVVPAAEPSSEPVGLLAPRVELLQQKLRAIGPVNQMAAEEHAAASERLQFLSTQVADLRATIARLDQVRVDLDRGIEADFLRTFEAASREFGAYFRRLFGGGDAMLVLTQPHNLREAGVEIQVQQPGKRRQELAMLSGGQRALVAAALLFALLKVRPTPFVLLDEADAALDEANVSRFCDVLQELAQHSQIVVVTHNRTTMERADVLYGMAMSEHGVSSVLSLNLGDHAAEPHPFPAG